MTGTRASPDRMLPGGAFAASELAAACWLGGVEGGREWHPAIGLRGAGEIFASGREGAGAALALALAQTSPRTDARGTVPGDERAFLWVQDRAAIRAGGRPFVPGLPPALGRRMVHVAAKDARDALFALEEGVRCRDLAFVIGEIAGNPRALDFTASRRLVLAAERHRVPLWLVRIDARRDLGAARMRWDVASARSDPPRFNPQAPGGARWRGELFRARGLRPGAWWIRHDSEGDEHGELHAVAARQADASEAGSAEAGAGDLVRAAGDRSLASR